MTSWYRAKRICIQDGQTLFEVTNRQTKRPSAPLENTKVVVTIVCLEQVPTEEEEQLVGQILSEVNEGEIRDWWVGGNNHADQVN